MELDEVFDNKYPVLYRLEKLKSLIKTTPENITVICGKMSILREEVLSQEGYIIASVVVLNLVLLDKRLEAISSEVIPKTQKAIKDDLCLINEERKNVLKYVSPLYERMGFEDWDNCMRLYYQLENKHRAVCGKYLKRG